MSPKDTAHVPVREAIRSHLTLMTARWSELRQKCYFELRAIHPEEDPKFPVLPAHFTPGRIEEAVEWAVAQNDRGYNVYLAPNAIRLDHKGAATDSSILAAFFVWADCDSSESVDNLMQYAGPRWNAAVSTGHTPSPRLHPYWQLAEPAFNLDAWRGLQVAIAAHFKSDPSVKNASRVMRLAGTVSWPPARKVARGYVPETVTIEVDPEREAISFEDLMVVFPPIKAGYSKSGDTGTGDERKTVDDYRDALRRARTDGEKHGGVRDLAASLAGMGVTRKLAEAFIRDVCPVSDDGVAKLIESAYAKFYEDREEAEAAAEAGPEHDHTGENRQAPVDLWGLLAPPVLPTGLLPPVLEAFAFVQGEDDGGRPWRACSSGSVRVRRHGARQDQDAGEGP